VVGQAHWLKAKRAPNSGPAPQPEACQNCRCNYPEGKLSYGVIASNSGLNLQAFAERAHIPVAFTLHGLSAMPVDHPVSLGMVGMHGTVEANRAMMNADLIIGSQGECLYWRPWKRIFKRPAASPP